MPEPPTEFVPSMCRAHGIESLSLDEESTLYASRLPLDHREPFDRMLVCQAIVQSLAILTPDEDIRRYPVKTRW